MGLLAAVTGPAPLALEVTLAKWSPDLWVTLPPTHCISQGLGTSSGPQGHR